MKKNTYVIAGNYSEFCHSKYNKKEYIYVNEVIQLFGKHGMKVVLIGTYYMRKDWEKIKLLIKIHDAEIEYEK